MKNMSFEWIEDRFNKSSGNDAAHNKDFCCQEAQEVEQLKYKVDFCARYMSKNLEVLQEFVNAHNKNYLPDEDSDPKVESVLISIAELKKIRDILRGTIAFENSLN